MFLIKSNNFNFSNSNALEFLKNQNKFDRSMILFWFLGPVFFLIERSPSDLWHSAGRPFLIQKKQLHIKKSL